MLRQILNNKLPRRLISSLKRWKNHRYEVIFSLFPSPLLPSTKLLPVQTKRYRYVRQFLLEYLLEVPQKKRIKFLNYGCGDGTAKHQFFQHEFDEPPLSPEYFFSKVDYFTNETFDLDLNKMKEEGLNVYFPSYKKEQLISADYLKDYPTSFQRGHLKGNIADPLFPENFKEHLSSFDIIYSSDVLEHTSNPFQAVKNVLSLLKPGGLCITIVPFSYPYHPDPTDYFRFTHEGLTQLFREARSKPFEVIHYSYDITDRRDNRKGNSVPIDQFGGWRENWMLLHIIRAQN